MRRLCKSRHQQLSRFIFHLPAFSKWSKSSYEFFHTIWLSGLSEETGIIMLPCYRLTTDADGYRDTCWQSIPFGSRRLDANEVARLSAEHGRPYTGGVHFITFCCEPVKFLPYLFKRFLAAGGRFERRKVLDFNEFADADLIVNCSGLGGKVLANDENSHPIRGQVARVDAPWVMDVMLDDSDDGNYIIPNANAVVLGGTHTFNDYNVKLSRPDSEFIFAGCHKLNPSLKHAETIREWVGLRPGRTSVRLEIETEMRRNATPIVHNYGHGGCGVTLCWGCGDEVLENVIKVLQVPSVASKL